MRFTCRARGCVGGKTCVAAARAACKGAMWGSTSSCGGQADDDGSAAVQQDNVKTTK